MTRRLSVLILFAPVFAFPADPSLLQLLPPDAVTVGGLNVDQARNSPLGQYLITNMANEENGFEKLQDLTGFDPRRDLREVLMASSPQSKQGLFAARGLFDQSRILQAAKDHGKATMVYQGVNVIADNGDEKWIAFLDAGTVIGGQAEAVKKAIAQRSKAPAQPYASAVQALSAQYDAWLYSTDPARFPTHMPKNSNTQVLQGVQKAKGGIKLGVNVQIDAEATARSEKDAVALQDVIRFLAGMVQLNRDKPGAADVATMLDSLQISTQANLVTLSLKIPETDLEKLIEKNRERRQARRSRAPRTI